MSLTRKIYRDGWYLLSIDSSYNNVRESLTRDYLAAPPIDGSTNVIVALPDQSPLVNRSDQTNYSDISINDISYDYLSSPAPNRFTRNYWGRTSQSDISNNSFLFNMAAWCYFSFEDYDLIEIYNNTTEQEYIQLFYGSLRDDARWDNSPDSLKYYEIQYGNFLLDYSNTGDINYGAISSGGIVRIRLKLVDVIFRMYFGNSVTPKSRIKDRGDNFSESDIVEHTDFDGDSFADVNRVTSSGSYNGINSERALPSSSLRLSVRFGSRPRYEQGGQIVRQILQIKLTPRY